MKLPEVPYQINREYHAQVALNYGRACAIAALEAAAQLAESLGVHPALNVFGGGPEWYKHGKDCAAAIRAMKADIPDRP